MTMMVMACMSMMVKTMAALLTMLIAMPLTMPHGWSIIRMMVIWISAMKLQKLCAICKTPAIYDNKGVKMRNTKCQHPTPNRRRANQKSA